MLGTALLADLQSHGGVGLQLVRRAPTQENELEWNPDAARPLTNADALEGLAAVVHLGGANVAARRWDAEYRRKMTSSRIQSTHALATVLAGLRQPPPVLLVASATGIYGDRGDEVLTEESPAGSGFLAELCQLWEDSAAPAVRAGIRVVHLRFGVVLGPGAGALGKMLPLFRMGLGGRLGSGRQWSSWISLDDTVAAVRFLLEKPAAAGPYNLVAPNPVTNAEFTRALAAAVHRPAIFHAPAFALRLAVGQMADEALLASTRVLPARLQHAGFGFQHPTVAEALCRVVPAGA